MEFKKSAVQIPNIILILLVIIGIFLKQASYIAGGIGGLFVYNSVALAIICLSLSYRHEQTKGQNKVNLIIMVVLLILVVLLAMYFMTHN
ncbi:LasU family protein [Companilactobacillus mishanensis]|uniref:Uncharacterized protein n=1 Tax=Companilactobacillus mishanensis TaxID=2486008 RepID=A0A5P0ZIY9_9LACO|nr:LasU family protein [Companilactobacillus mishanensis]MQS44672.1 hypothetical protein [Companilactobacillus mishanensis]MQS53060.1 hypothetical protein [Companilactobacillus mishanensis]